MLEVELTSKRSAVSVSVQTFLPFALQRGGLTDNERSWVLAGFILFGGIGGFFGGALADRFGARRVTMAAMLLATPLMIAAFSVHGLPSYLLLMAGGTMLNLPIPVSVVMAQRLVPLLFADIHRFAPSVRLHLVEAFSGTLDQALTTGSWSGRERRIQRFGPVIRAICSATTSS